MATVTFKDDLPNTTTTTTTPKNKTTTLRRWLTFSTSTSSSHRRSSSPRPKPTRRPTPKPTININTNTTSSSNSNSTTTRLYRRVTLPRRSSKSKTKTRTIHPDDDTHTHTPTSLLTSINTTTNTGTPTSHPLVSTNPNPITPPPTSPTSPSSTTTNNNKIRSRSPLSPLSPLSLNFSTLFNLSPRSKTIEESSSSTYSSSVSEIHIPPPTVSHEQLTSSYAEYCEAFTEGRTEESFLYQEDDGDKGARPVKEIVIKEEKGCLEERCSGKEGGGEGGQCVVDTKEEDGKGNGDGDRAIPCSDDQREILHWMRESDEEEQDSGSNAEDVPLRVSPPARILTPARYEQSRRAARQPQHGKQEHHEDQRHAWWTALRVGWTRMRRRTSKAANPDYN
ncbi:hypothetical protein AtubIFM55763_007613 [Aspergillus tubingensis]|uniref:Similar to An11g05720 n=1 Tax=Aspergillus niger TaxID=5061 RepID=A0A100IK71_ASPNG|nr:similar to An11g05720 [Aspergillus niger]GLA65591.1 hypothetical protein AtubIFM54640_007776 [Aspergillus tubingensis]GLA76047.1 hypothetical protein AtubIFM55763_007613 [Aspergillus tubingensis]GLA92185.1 hypothetical protein AtubIFM57143_007696 [Aspergillus tubingensis]GLB17567.1 hypothetical protein AtubIFM61612_007445 [Aspergillus tubingensis]